MNTPSAPVEAGCDAAVMRDVNLRLHAFEKAWNEPDIHAVMSQYDTSFTFNSTSGRRDHREYMSELHSLFAEEDRSRLSLGISSTRVLSPDCVLVDGTVHERFMEHEIKALFTVIYRRIDGDWRMIHAHTCHV